MANIFDSKYVRKHQEDYHKLLWYETDLMTYYDSMRCKDMTDNPGVYF